MTTDVINGVPRDEFQREERYVVVKISKMHPHPEFRRRHLEALKAENIAALVDCVVVEKDWPEYETVWKMIEARVSGATAQPAADGEREAFEAVYAGRCNFERNPHHPDIYANEPCRARWEAWQARAAQPKQAVAVTDEVRRLREALESKVPLYEAVERACGELPDGWAITLQMENGAGWVELYDAEGNQVEDFPTNNERLDYTLCDAVDAALAARKTGEEE